MVVSPDANCLDLACGFGNFLAFLEASGVRSFIGVDGSDAAVNEAINRFGAERAVCSDVFSFLQTSTSSFDLISALDLLEHLSKKELYDLLDLAISRLAPTGRLLVRVPNASGLFGMASRYNDITHETCFTPGALRDVFDAAGLNAIAVWEDTGHPTDLKQILHRFSWELVRFGIRCVDAIETGTWGEGVFTRNMWALAERRT
jgi:SAM-dependent methyltransferase